MATVTSKLRDRVRQWEYKNIVHGAGYVDKTTGGHRNLASNMATRGYDAMRVSPQITRRNGLQYRAVYGAEIAPNYRYKTSKGKYTPKVTWHRQGYVKARSGQKTGTVMLGDMRSYPVDQKMLKSQLMMKSRRRR